MSNRIKVAVTALTAVSAAALLFSATAFAQGAQGGNKPTRIRGSIVSVAGDVLTVHRNSGDNVKITMTDKTPVSAVRNIKLSDIKPGSFIGTAATTGVDGTLTAREVVVFPESARGTGEGHYAWDLGNNSTMTNANVDSVLQSTDGRNLKLSYKGGSNNVVVPENVPVVTFAAATHADLTPGKKVFVVATGPDTGYQGQRIVVEKDGVVPPM